MLKYRIPQIVTLTPKSFKANGVEAKKGLQIYDL